MMADTRPGAGRPGSDGRLLKGPASLLDCERIDPALRDGLPLDNDEAHLWLLPLDAPPRPVAELAAFLDEAERGRAAHLAQPGDRHRSVIGRGLLRLLLGAYTGSPAAQVRFVYGPFGKPVLAQGSGASPPMFNLAHAGGLALLGVARRAIGVDLERVRPMAERDELARQFFTPREAASIARLPPSRRDDGFYACWTSKEAFLKQTGEGMSRAMNRFEVATDPDRPALLLSVDGSAQAARAYRLWSGRLLADHWAAVAVEGPAPALRFMRL